MFGRRRRGVRVYDYCMRLSVYMSIDRLYIFVVETISLRIVFVREGPRCGAWLGSVSNS